MFCSLIDDNKIAGKKCRKNSFQVLANITDKCRKTRRDFSTVRHFSHLATYFRFIPLAGLPKHGYKCNNKDCERNGLSGRMRCLTSPMERHGTSTAASNVSPPFLHDSLISSAFRRSQTLSPVRNYNTLTSSAAKEPKFVTIKRTTEQYATKPVTVNIQRLSGFSV